MSKSAFGVDHEEINKGLMGAAATAGRSFKTGMKNGAAWKFTAQTTGAMPKTGNRMFNAGAKVGGFMQSGRPNLTPAGIQKPKLSNPVRAGIAGAGTVGAGSIYAANRN